MSLPPSSQSVRDAISLAGAPLLVGFSGGVDSTVLLHALAHSPAVRAAGLRAIHVHHGLLADADAWGRHCEAVCRQWNVPLEVHRVQVARDSGQGLEGAARQARRAAFAQTLRPGEWLALAHHQDDQAETFLLRALRASGPDGLASMRASRPFGAGTLWRPLLGLPRAALLEYAQAHGLTWVEDPGNADTDLDRNFLRQRVLPLLRQRWPHSGAALARSAELSAQAGDLLDVEDRRLLRQAVQADGQLSLGLLRPLPASRRARVLRAWVERERAPPLPARGIAAIESGLFAGNAADGAGFRWQDVQIRHWRDALYLQRLPAPALPAGWHAPWDGTAALLLPDGAALRLEGAGRFDHELQVRARQGGERIVLAGRTHSHALKHVLQDAGMPPWERARLPLLFDGRELLAAGDRILSARLSQWLRQRDAALCWQRAN